MTDKDVMQMLENLTPLAASMTVTRPSSVRARDPKEVAKMIPPGPSDPRRRRDRCGTAPR